MPKEHRRRSDRQAHPGASQQGEESGLTGFLPSKAAAGSPRDRPPASLSGAGGLENQAPPDRSSQPMNQVKILLDEAEIPTHWYNVVADLPKPPAPPLGP